MGNIGSSGVVTGVTRDKLEIECRKGQDKRKILEETKTFWKKKIMVQSAEACFQELQEDYQTATELAKPNVVAKANKTVVQMNKSNNEVLLHWAQKILEWVKRTPLRQLQTRWTELYSDKPSFFK